MQISLGSNAADHTVRVNNPKKIALDILKYDCLWHDWLSGRSSETFLCHHHLALAALLAMAERSSGVSFFDRARRTGLAALGLARWRLDGFLHFSGGYLGYHHGTAYCVRWAFLTLWSFCHWRPPYT